jgi:hypothetical protein
MQRVHRIFLTLVFFLALFPVLTMAWRIIPGQVVTVMMDVIPDHAAAGDIVTVTGFGLNPSLVRDVFLVDARRAYSVEILEQTGSLIRFRVPATVPSGRKRLAAAVRGRAELVEQDAYLVVTPTPGNRPTETDRKFPSGS